MKLHLPSKTKKNKTACGQEIVKGVYMTTVPPECDCRICSKAYSAVGREPKGRRKTKYA